MVRITRRKLLIGGATALAVGATATWWVRRSAPIGFTLDDEQLAQARALLARVASIDMHAHPGRSFLHAAAQLSPKIRWYALHKDFEQATIDDMRVGGLSASVFAAVADIELLDLAGNGLAAVREFAPGQAFASYQRQLARLRSLLDRGQVMAVLGPSDVAAARRAGRIGAMFSVEGGDFLEGRAERVEQAYADGVRTITLMHYHTNELGDIMIAPPVHGGLTAAGREVVAAMNRTGMVIDVAHATEATVRGVLERSDKPVMASHTHLHRAGRDHPRFVSVELARAIAGAGGVIGAWPAGIGISDLGGFVSRVIELVDAVGVAHVGLGTDMDANYQPVMDNYLKLPWLVGGLLQRGLAQADIAQILGGNFLRVFAAQRASAEAASLATPGAG